MENNTPQVPAKKIVLVVDDDKQFVEDMVKKFEAVGFHGIGLYSGKEALDYVGSRPVDLILLDFIMPEMDGYTFYHVMTHDMKKNIPTIVLTSMAHPSKGDLGLETYVKNETNLDELVGKIKGYLIPVA